MSWPGLACLAGLVSVCRDLPRFSTSTINQRRQAHQPGLLGHPGLCNQAPSYLARAPEI